MNTNSTIKALENKIAKARIELQKERANKDRILILRPFAHKGLDDSFDFPDEYYASAKRIRNLMEFGGKCQKALELLKEIENNQFGI